MTQPKDNNPKPQSQPIPHPPSRIVGNTIIFDLPGGVKAK